MTAEYELGSDPRRKLGLSFEAQGAVGEKRRRGNLWLATTWRARPNLMVSLTPELNLEVNDAQYVKSVADRYAHTFGQRYVFMSAKEESFSLGTRAELVLKPELTLQVYARPFAASGDFRKPSELSLAGRDALMSMDRQWERFRVPELRTRSTLTGGPCITVHSR